MTVIAWDGEVLAADKRVSFGTSIATTTKIHQINGMLVGCSGGAAQGASCIQWVRDGMVRSQYPDSQKDDACSMLIIMPDGAIHYYSKTPDPLIVEGRTFAIGSGSEYAEAAMYLGKTAREAVAVAIALDSGCGNGVDELVLA